MSTATPLWVPLLVAAFGVAGTVTAAVLTQILTRRRDRQRWQIERDERREQWRREDAARWLADRRTAYAELLAALHEQHALLISARRLTAEGRRPDAAATARQDQVRETLQRSRHAAGLLAGPPVAQPMDALIDLVLDPADRDLSDFPDRFARLRDHMRDDLGGT
jgi:hypothetical protein